VASCRRIAVEVTTVLGDTAGSTSTLCVPDEEGSPPGVGLRVDDTPGEPVRVGLEIAQGSDSIVGKRLWIDDQELDGSSTVALERDEGCHAVDAMVYDAQGRIGLAQKTICTGVDGPRLWLGADPGACLPLGERFSLCAEAHHPLGLTMEVSAGNVPMDDCEQDEAVPNSFGRRLMRVTDAAGIEATASVFVCGAPKTGAPRLLFAALPDAVQGKQGISVQIPALISGGEPPFHYSATLRSNLRGRTTPVEVQAGSDPRAPVIRVEQPAEGTGQLELTVSDAAGLSASAKAVLTVGPSPPANGYSSADSSSGCSTVEGAPSGGGSMWLMFLAVGLHYAARRRRGSEDGRL
jgi:MYXO-CTERM domain-containing protein